jgi:hypothetical protein
MNLKRATFAETSISAEDAKITLLGEKIDTIYSYLHREAPLRLLKEKSPPQLRVGEYIIRFLPDGFFVTSTITDETSYYDDWPTIENSPLWRSITPAQRVDIKRNSDAFCQNMIPF